MAARMHIVEVMVQDVNAITGVRINKATASNNDILNTEMRHLIKPDSAVPSSANWPTIPAYLALEASSDYIVQLMNQTYIVTYHKDDI